jgi:hypothetical protein
MDQKLSDFFNHLNIIHLSMQFTMETESNSHFLFLDIHIYWRTGTRWGTLCTGNPPTPNCIWILNPTTTGLITILVLPSGAIWNYENLPEELELLRRQIRRALNSRRRENTTTDDPKCVVFFPFHGPINRISRVTSRGSIETVGLLPIGSPVSIGPTRMTLAWITGRLQYPWICGKVYSRQAGVPLRRIEDRQRHNRLYYPETSSTAQTESPPPVSWLQYSGQEIGTCWTSY